MAGTLAPQSVSRLKSSCTNDWTWAVGTDMLRSRTSHDQATVTLPIFYAKSRKASHEEESARPGARSRSVTGRSHPGIAVGTGHSRRVRGFFEPGLRADVPYSQQDTAENGYPPSVRVSEFPGAREIRELRGGRRGGGVRGLSGSLLGDARPDVRQPRHIRFSALPARLGARARPRPLPARVEG